jgi:hypothetical protein
MFDRIIKIRRSPVMRRMILSSVVSVILAICAARVSGDSQPFAPGAGKMQKAKVCFDPSVPCRTSVRFEAHDLPFQVPKNAVIWETVEFYAIILKSVSTPGGDCERFVSEKERLSGQALFPNLKVFTSRPCNPGGLFYTNVAPDQQFMAVYAGATRAQAELTLQRVQATGKFPGANIRRMRAGFNGT